jgi:hypothetical protein
MEHIPDSKARNAALEEAVHAAVEAVQAEERATEARACAAQMISDAVARLTDRMDAYITRREEQQRQDEAEAEHEEQERIKAELDALPDPDNPDPFSFDRKERASSPTDEDHEGIIPDPDDPTGTELETDAGCVPMSYSSPASAPMSYVKKESTDPIPFDPDAPGNVDVPSLGPEPGSPLYPPHPQVAQPIAISLNEE